MRYGKTTKNL